MQALSSHYEIYKRVCFYTRLWPQSPFLLSAPGVVTMTFSGVISRNTSPTTSLPSAVTSLNATGTTLGAPLAQVASVCPVCQEALSDEESAEAPPAAEEARRFRGSVLTAGRGSGWEPADTTVSAEEHAKKITTQMGGDLWSGRRGKRRSAACGGRSEAVSRKCPDCRPRQRLGAG